MIPEDYKEEGKGSGSKKRRKRMRKGLKTMVGRKQPRASGGLRPISGGQIGGGRVPGIGGKGP